jgi:hypothetical protein
MKNLILKVTIIKNIYKNASYGKDKKMQKEKSERA